MNEKENPILAAGYCQEYGKMNRRTFIARSLQAVAGLTLGSSIVPLPTWMPQFQLADPAVGPRGDTLVCLFLRGGADGLNIVVPHGEDQYYKQRPTISIPRPDDRNAAKRTLDLDGFFGLHPALAPLIDIYQNSDLAIVQAVGSPDQTRSHFEAMDLMERGATTDGDYTGWLTRHLASLNSNNQSALRAIGIGDLLPASLTGTITATALESIGAYHLAGRSEQTGKMGHLLQQLYENQTDLLQQSAAQTFAAIDLLQQIDTERYKPLGRKYPERPLGRALMSVAQLIKAEVGVEVATVDFGGWDTHVGQGSGEGLMANLLTQLGESLAAFYEDLGDLKGKVTVVLMSEFGRRVQENGGLGTDHGHGSMMMLLGGNVNGGNVFGNWPGLHPEQQVGPGDLATTTDYRDVLTELVQHRLNNPNVTTVFPGYQANPLNIVAH